MEVTFGEGPAAMHIVISHCLSSTLVRYVYIYFIMQEHYEASIKPARVSTCLSDCACSILLLLRARTLRVQLCASDDCVLIADAA